MSVIFTQSSSFHMVPDLKDITYIMSHPNSTSSYILQNGIFEKELIEYCKNNLCCKDRVFLDLGAHIGTYTLNLAHAFSHIYAFEAQKNTYYMLCGNVVLNNLTDLVTTKHCALSNIENDGKIVTLNIVSEDGGGSSIVNTNTSKVLRSEQVISKPLDYFNISNIGLIKIDVEGAELDVIQGGLKTLERSNYPPILFEAWSDPWYAQAKEKLFSFLQGIGYTIKPMLYNNMFLATHS